MTFLSKLKEGRDRKTRWKIKAKKNKRLIISPHLIEAKVKNLVQWCDRCREITGHERITYDKGKRACKCINCSRITSIATKK